MKCIMGNVAHAPPPHGPQNATGTRQPQESRRGPNLTEHKLEPLYKTSEPPQNYSERGENNSDPQLCGPPDPRNVFVRSLKPILPGYKSL